MRDTIEYQAIARHYGTRTTRRSGVPLMRHIDEGLAMLDHLGATRAARRAFCLHPLLQADADFAARIGELGALTTDVHVVALVVEYRHVANAALASRPLASPADIALSPLPEVQAMLIADKVQNRCDFLSHHRASHPRAEHLDRYFRLWLERLGVDDARYAELVRAAASEDSLC